MAHTAAVSVNGIMHRRKSSKEDMDSMLTFSTSQSPPERANPLSQTISLNGSTPKDSLASLPARSRVTSNPRPISVSQPFTAHPASTGPYRASVPVPAAPSPQPMKRTSSSHEYGPPSGRHQAPGMRQSLSLPTPHAHSRTRSVSGPFSFAPMTPSPLSASFPSQQLAMPTTNEWTLDGLPSISTAPELHNIPAPLENRTKSVPRHSRIHSRNLSVYFPRPGSLPASVIAEDGAQEIEFTSSPEHDEGVLIPSVSPGPGQRTFREGFTFGGRPPSSSSSSQMSGSMQRTLSSSSSSSSSGGTLRRGHHHKHSLSHNFFSFLDPSSQTPSPDLHTQPTPVPLSPWAPISPLPSSQSVRSLEGENAANGHPVTVSTSYSKRVMDIGRIRASIELSPVAIGASLWQFILGAWLWVAGQQAGSLACTGLGYWVVFDAFGVALGHILPSYLAGPSMRAETRRPYGNTRLETVMTFAQSVYLIFTSIYVCKETVEHLLLSSGEGHHHHHGDEESSIHGIEFPIRLLFVTLISLLTTTIAFKNQSRLVSTAGNRVPSLAVFLPTRSRSLAVAYPGPLHNLLTNPYTLAPICFALCALFTALSVPPPQHRWFDLILAGIETAVTFNLAYRASVALGAVLLQTSPARGLAGGRMEAFLRAMREIERHPQVLHLPAPHIWQLTPSLAVPEGATIPPYANAVVDKDKAHGPAQSLVVTLELHVRHDLEDGEVLKLTRWAWERCVHALRFGTRGGEGGEGEAEVTVGIVKG